MYAIIRTGGKQYTVREGDLLDVELLPNPAGESLELRDVLMIGEGGEIAIGTPLIAGAKVVAEVVEHGKGDKIIVFKYKPKTRYRKKAGHRQRFTRLAIKEIVAP